MSLTAANVFVVAPHFFRPSRNKTYIVTAVTGREIVKELVQLWFLRHSTDYKAE